MADNDRNDRDGNRNDGRYRARGGDRGFFDRGVDEVRSWFGDNEADQRRGRDDDGYHYDADNRGRYEDDNRNAGFRGTWGRDDRGGRPEPSRGFGAYQQGGSTYGSRQAEARPGSHHDDDYRNWRDRQIASFDRDYEDYRRERQDRFHSDFESWRNNRSTQAGAEATGVQWRTKIRDHQEVLGSDGEHVGTVDHVQGDRIKLSKRDGDGEHHFLPLTAIVSVDNAVRLNVTAEDARRQWRGDNG